MVAAMETASYEVRRSARRRRTMSISRQAGRLVVTVPARMSATQERQLVPGFVRGFLAKEAARRLPVADTELQERAKRLFAAHLRPAAEGFEPVFSVRWSGRMERRWGSATTASGTIRISERLRTMPAWVGDYVLVHELAHLLETNHTKRFWALVARYPLAERARGYLEGFSHASDGEGAGEAY